jgi:hypothetical protein
VKKKEISTRAKLKIAIAVVDTITAISSIVLATRMVRSGK